MVASVAKAQHLGRDLDTLRVNYAWLHYGRSIYVVGVYMCTRVTHRDVDYEPEDIVALVSLAYLICISQKYTE